MALADILQKVVDNKEASIKRQMPLAAELIEGAIKETLDTPGSPEHHAPPGVAPYRQTGNLMNQTYADVKGDYIIAGSHATYAGYVAKRHPYVAKAWAAIKDKFTQTIKEAK